VRSRKVSDLNADILEGHLSSALCHMGNISYRLGRRTASEEIKEAVKNRTQIAETFGRLEEHLFNNWIDLSKEQVVLGSRLQMDPRTEKFVGSGEYSMTRWANDLLKRDYRKPFAVPEDV
jgi:hypothetical protein